MKKFQRDDVMMVVTKRPAEGMSVPWITFTFSDHGDCGWKDGSK